MILRFIKRVGLLILLFIVSLCVTVPLPTIGIILSGVIIITGLVSYFRPLKYGFDNKVFSTFAILISMFFGSIGIYYNSEDYKLMELQIDNPEAYEIIMNQKREEQKQIAAAEALERKQKFEEEKAISAAEAIKQKQIKEAEDAKKLVLYKQELQMNIDELKKFDTKIYIINKNMLFKGIEKMDSWVDFYVKGKSINLDVETTDLLKQFKESIVQKQKAVFPIFRDAYGPILSNDMWIDNGSAKTFGNSYKTIELVSFAFASNRNISNTQDSMYEILHILRFTKIQYRWHEGSEYSYYKIYPPRDTDLVVWDYLGTFHTVD